MQNIMFTPPANEKVLDGTKTMTARFWRREPPALSSIVTASTGRKKETRFAEIQIVGGCIWYPQTDTGVELFERIGYSPSEIAIKEGFQNWKEFIDAYVSLNPLFTVDDPKRRHYFLEFELIRDLTLQDLTLQPLLF